MEEGYIFSGVVWICQTKPKFRGKNKSKIRKEVLNLQVLPFVLYENARLGDFLIFVPFLSPVCPFFVPRFLYLCMWDKKQ